MRFPILSSALTFLLMAGTLSVAATADEPSHVDGQTIPATGPVPTAGVGSAPGQPDTTSPDASASSGRAASPVVAALRAAIEHETADLTELRSQLAAATDEAQALALQKQISERKEQTQLDMLRIQVDFAKRAGQIELAAKLEAAIERTIHPPAPKAPIETRPHPGRSDSARN